MANGLQWEWLTGAKMATSGATVGVSDWSKDGDQWGYSGSVMSLHQQHTFTLYIFASLFFP